MWSEGGRPTCWARRSTPSKTRWRPSPRCGCARHIFIAIVQHDCVRPSPLQGRTGGRHHTAGAPNTKVEQASKQTSKRKPKTRHRFPSGCSVLPALLRSALCRFTPHGHSWLVSSMHVHWCTLRHIALTAAPTVSPASCGQRPPHLLLLYSQDTFVVRIFHNRDSKMTRRRISGWSRL